VGELATMVALVLVFDGGTHAAVWNYHAMMPVLFWLFLGGFIWVIGDLFQQFATKYVGIGRGIPLSNTNQLWGLAWGALVFGELRHADAAHRLMVIAGSAVMIAGALAVSTAVASERERESTEAAIARECARYGLDAERVRRTMTGEAAEVDARRAWWDWVIVAGAVVVFVVLGVHAHKPALAMNSAWTAALGVMLALSAVVCVTALSRTGRRSAR
jgi:glucose uptake protein GlcU